jgi:peptidoglycan hydrolase-like protein with peptidoglycan-binding domain
MVMAFQAANGLEDDGAVGKDTWPKLNDGSAVSNSSTNQATSVKDPFEVPGSDSSIMQESRKKILRKYLQEFK